ncbi:MAG: GspH/FimT family pseudopilin [Aliiglaciecola sp.]|uniref:GspH/FimT family pseudopilin n=1 Tax=Aliiglaciecola sp. TaxID=1872441 RepID=UPI003298E6D4
MRINQKHRFKRTFLPGFTILEVMVVLSIIALLSAVGAPSIMQTLRHQQLKGSLQTSYFLLQQAKSTAITQNKQVTVQFEKGENWCIALSDSGPCDCQLHATCKVDEIEYRVSADDYPNVLFSDITMGKNQAIIFDGVRGTAIGNAGSGVFSNGNEAAKLIVSNLGRVRICMQHGHLGAFQAC